MEKNKMKQGDVLLVKVIEVIQNKKTGIKKGAFLYDRHDIFFEDKKGEKYVGEYLTNNIYDDDFPIGHWQHIRCEHVSDYGFEVRPTDPEEKQYLPNHNVGKQPQQNEVKCEPRQKVGNMSGTSIAFAYAFAKDLVVAKMTHELMLNLSEEELANKVSDIADKINERMLKAAQ